MLSNSELSVKRHPDPQFKAKIVYIKPVSRKTFCSWCKSLICFCKTTEETPVRSENKKAC